MPLLNYTTTIAASKTVGEIIGILASHGAKSILMNYGSGGQVEALSFQILTPQGNIAIRLPVDPDAILKVMARQGLSGKYLNRTHAIRVAWRIVKDWVKAQMALVETEMVRTEQVFLPYAITGNGQTIYESLVESKFKMLTREE